MKKFKVLTILLFALIISSTSLAQQVANVETKTFKSRYFSFDREVLIYTPENYNEATQSEYDVIYVFDAQARSFFDLVHALLHYNVQEQNDQNFIVVGVVSPFMPEIEYHRNNDFLPIPEHITLSTPYYGKSNEFKKFIKEELMPYINTHYQTSGHTLAIGHSLGASFALDVLVTDELFDDYIAISPNFAWDKERFARGFMQYDFNNKKPRYIYLSMANESEMTGWPIEWRPAWRKVKKFVETSQLPQYVQIKISEFPALEHNKTILPALLEALSDYVKYRQSPIISDSTLYPVHIELSGASLRGDVYITGNQSSLCNWNPQGVKMKQLNDSTYSIDLQLQLPVDFKFTQGSWENQIWIENGNAGNQRISLPSKTTKYYKTF